jgi:hypothetical protein
VPLPIAHPAAILPLRRLCPICFNFPALIIGSLVPDLGYCFPTLQLGAFSHSPAGAFAFCLPSGFLLLAILWLIAPRCSWAQRFGPALLRFHSSVGFVVIIVISLLCGIGTHLLLDSMTHRYGAIVRAVPALRIPLWMFAHHHVRVYHLLWYGFSFAGVAWLSLAFQAWRARAEKRSPRSFQSRSLTATAFGLAAIVIGALHHAIPGTVGDVAGAVCSVALAAVAFRWS